MNLAKLNTKKTYDFNQESTFSYCCVQMQGWRNSMEDAHIAIEDIGDGNSLFAVFDGHGGDQISNFLKDNFVRILLSLEEYKIQKYEEALQKCFSILDKLILTEIDKGQQRVVGKQSIPICFLTGSTANVLLITKQKYYIANCGDSRSALMRQKECVELSFDHKPENAEELNRITKAGGTVKEGRVNGNLNLSRAFGDFMYKLNEKIAFEEQIIISKPDINVVKREGKDTFILMGCDGIWQRYETSSSGLLQIVNSDMKMGMKKKEIVENLLDLLVSKNILQTKGKGCDNMTAILIILNSACK